MRTRVVLRSLLLLAMAIAPTAPADAAGTEHGKTLLEQHCTKCHDSRVFTRPEHRIRSLEALKTQVRTCELNASLNWTQRNIDDVVAYLDATY